METLPVNILENIQENLGGDSSLLDALYDDEIKEVLFNVMEIFLLAEWEMSFQYEEHSTIKYDLIF